MTETSAPWELITTGDATVAPYSAYEWSGFQSKLIGYGASRADYGIIKGNSATPASSVAFYGLDVRAPGTTNVTLKLGTAVVLGTLYENTADLSLAVGANASGNPRIDTVILRRDHLAQTIRAVLKQGTPAASPVPPTLTQSALTTWEIAIADVAVANGFATITQADITPRQAHANIPDTIVLDAVQNKSGGELITGDVVVWNNPGGTNPQTEVTTTTTVNDRLVAGVWIGRTANNGYGRLLVKGVGLVNVDLTFASGVLITYSTAKQARFANTSGAGQSLNILGFAFDASGSGGGGTGLRFAYIDCQVYGAYDYIRFVDQVAQNTQGGTFTNGAWRTRNLNTQSFGPAVVTIATVGSNQITINRAGRYVIRASAPAFNVDGHQTRLQNVSVGSTFAEGTSEYAPTGVQTRSHVQMMATNIAAGTVIELQHRCITTRATDGLGKAVNLTNEIYSVVELYREELGIS